MNSFTNSLFPGEKILAVCKKNWTFFLNCRCIIGLFFALLFLSSLPLFSIIILVGAMTPTILEYFNTELVLTNEKLRGKQGAFKINTVENKASYFIGNVKTESNVILHALGSDTIVIESKGVGKFVFTHMKNVNVMSSALYSLENENEIQIVNKF